MRQERDFEPDVRSSALWGKGGRGERRSSALWGKGGRGAITTVLAATALALPLVASADNDRGQGKGKTYVAPGVFQAAEHNAKVRVIIQSTGGARDAGDAAKTNGEGSVLKELDEFGMVVAELPAGRIHALSKREGLTVTLDAPVKKASYTSSQLWPHQNGVAKLWGTALKPAPQAPGIAIIDSGIAKDRADFGFGRRIVARQVFGSSSGSSLDGRGHGTFVAGIAGGEAAGYAGASPTSNLFDLDVMDDSGMARTSDVIAACQWVLQNKDKGIRVVNLSLHSSSVLSIRYHPLNRAVEKLWFSGVTVVAAAGNYGVAGGPSGVRHAPGNDPFVITVGAYDLNNSVGLGRHDVPSWSAWGYTNEGFAKPDLVAAGRYMVGPVPAGATLLAEKPENVVAPGYMRLSGTSFATPVVAGIAAQILARNPSWTPDQVKGALMSTARRIPEAQRLEQGRGEVNAVRAATATRAPNPNLALNRFVVSDPAGGSIPVFDASAWHDAMKTDSAWDSSAWLDSAWHDSAWLDSAWHDSAWLDSAWLDSAWLDSAWADSVAYEDNAEGDGTGVPQPLTPTAAAEVAADPALALP
ncbi:MAG: S8 family serine peptidase [Actinomycetota bacterium]|nr:S8 family serine peptidase [Actinomycetota bacterium]